MSVLFSGSNSLQHQKENDFEMCVRACIYIMCIVSFCLGTDTTKLMSNSLYYYRYGLTSVDMSKTSTSPEIRMCLLCWKNKCIIIIIMSSRCHSELPLDLRYFHVGSSPIGIGANICFQLELVCFHALIIFG